MGDSRWLGIGLSAALLAAAGACVSHDDSCGGPTSDFPFCDGDDDRGPDGVSDGDGTGGEGETPGASPPGGDAGSPGASDGGMGADGGSCEPAPPIPCDDAVTPLDLQGQSPAGAVRVTAVSLDYVSGHVNPTTLRFDAVVGDQPEVIQASPRGTPPGAVIVGPGSYESGSSDPAKFLSVQIGCALAPVPLDAIMEIFEHTQVSLEAGGAGVLRGELRVLEPGWELTLPFEIHQACRQVGAFSSVD